MRKYSVDYAVEKKIKIEGRKYRGEEHLEKSKMQNIVRKNVEAVSKLIDSTNEQSQDPIWQAVAVVEINAVCQHFLPYPSQHAEQFHQNSIKEENHMI